MSRSVVEGGRDEVISSWSGEQWAQAPDAVLPGSSCPLALGRGQGRATLREVRAQGSSLPFRELPLTGQLLCVWYRHTVEAPRRRKDKLIHMAGLLGTDGGAVLCALANTTSLSILPKHVLWNCSRPSFV